MTAITGSSKVEKFGAQVTGRDALTLSVKEGLDHFCEILKETYKYYKKEDYKESFGWVDNFRRIKDEVKLNELDEKLLNLLKGNSFESRYWLAEPEVIDWEATAFYVLKKKRNRTDYYPELRLEKLIKILNKKYTNFTIQDIRGHSISSTDENYNVIKSWSAYNCLYAEIDDNNGLYVLQNGCWFNVEAGFVSKVNAAISKIEKYNHTLPVYNHKNEGEYNEFVSTKDGYVLMDKKTLNMEGGKAVLNIVT